MQGFNRYIPPDYDPKRTSTLNSYQGKKHALGKRAKDIDKGVLVVRFELPFNVWCEGCGNAAYVVHEGAKRQNDEWDPVANGGFAPIDTEAPSAADPPADAFAATEKTIDQQQWAIKHTSRLTELAEASDRQSLDPYEVSQSLRRRFRVEKAEMLEKQARDEGLRERFGLGVLVRRGRKGQGGGPAGQGGEGAGGEGVKGRDAGIEFDLGEEDVERARGMWVAARERAGLDVDPPSLGTETGGAAGAGPGAWGRGQTDEWGGGSTGVGAGDSVRAVSGTPAPSSISSSSGNGHGIGHGSSTWHGMPQALESSSKAAPSNTPTSTSTPNLEHALRQSTKRRYDPFADAADGFLSLSSSPVGKRPSVPARTRLPVKGAFAAPTASASAAASGVAAGSVGVDTEANAKRAQTHSSAAGAGSTTPRSDGAQIRLSPASTGTSTPSRTERAGAGEGIAVRKTIKSHLGDGAVSASAGGAVKLGLGMLAGYGSD